MSTAEYQRQWRARRGQGGSVGRPVTAPCDTPAAYKRHKRHGEPVDDACREAYNAEQRRLYQKRRTLLKESAKPLGTRAPISV